MERRGIFRFQMNSEDDPLRPLVGKIAESLGIELLKRSAGDERGRYRFGLTFRAELRVDPDILSPDVLHMHIDAVQGQIFRASVDHIAEHDHSPLDRLEQIERAARALLDAMGGLERIAVTGPGPVSSRAGELDQLLTYKPGAASWNPDGYGKDPVNRNDVGASTTGSADSE
jgi:hypothetical protein